MIMITAENGVTDSNYEVHYAKCAGGLSLCCRVRVAGWYTPWVLSPAGLAFRPFGEKQLVVSTQVGACNPDYVLAEAKVL